MKIIIGVLANDEDGYDKMVQACRETCYSNIPENFEVIYMYGHRGSYPIKNPYYIEGDCFYADMPSSRSLLTEKTLMFFDYCHKNKEFDYILRANCGSYLDLPKVLEHIKTLDSSGVYNGITGDVNGIKYCSGSAFIISKDVVGKIVKNMSKVKRYCHPGFIMDDVSIGEFLASENIKISGSARRAMLTYNDIEGHNFKEHHYHYYFKHTIDPRCLYAVHEKIAESAP